MKRYKMTFFLILIFIFILNIPLNHVMAETQTSGTFYGFNWEYGEDTRNFTKSANFADSFSESESRTNTRTYTRNAHIRTGLEIQDIFWERWTNRSKAAPSPTWELPGSPQNWLGYRADGYLRNTTDAAGAWYRYNGITGETPWVPWQQKLNLPWFGRQIDIGLAENIPTHTWYTSYANLTKLDNVTIPMQDWLGTIHDYTDIAKYHITYSYDGGTATDPNDDEIVFEELLIPRFILVRVETKIEEVSVNETIDVSASLSGQFNFSGTWEENLFGQHVSIKDGLNYWFDYFALISGNVLYDFEGGFTLAGSLSNNITREVKFTSNNTDVPESIRPVGLQSLRIRLSGEWDNRAEESGVLYGQGAIQSMIQVLLTKASTSQSPNLAVWGNFNPGRVIGYKDVDGDDLLTAFLNESQIGTPDVIMAVGFPEGAHLDGTYSASSSLDADVYMSLGDWIIADNESSVTVDVDKTINVTWGYDPRIPNPDFDVSLTWIDPVESDGEATFEWKTSYTNIPMTWWVRNDTAERIAIDDTDITYSYSLAIKPVLGEAILTSTYEQSEITDPQIRETMETQEMSMATYRRDYYLSMTQIGADTSGSFARPESQFEMTVAGKDLFSQNFGGTKKEYYLNSDPNTLYESGTSVLNLLTAEGFSGEPTNQTQRNPYSSPISKRLAVALTQWSADTHTEDIPWIFRENLVITSYPTWNGDGITHDPSYAAFYIGTDERIEETSEDLSTTEETESSGPPSTTAVDGVPGFGLTFSLVLLSVVTLLVRKRRYL
jgi:hypothetical protein